ncbi:MAG TPA: rhomboid family intramembrane serine protease [Dysgonamonadaceae bacterium]|nr:rhomboid family intramembrane serine protease [Dysgonamonadaceae bacterium]HOV35499.1 rhomboid family intramembrane serine protease [Dysgonamonadaceae bacterium]HQG07913.1 rhomboid family intramembrane serine protease [Dysgonamonadaceae bacterium]HQI43108.1 rhomboid family intramembrane serine protease [Dysgonamonadaceae bacterium]
MLNPQLAYERKRLWLAMIPSVIMVVLLWLFFVIDVSGIFGFPLYRLGILPREVRGLIGILFSPLLHESFSHLLSNTLPIFMLMWSLFYFYRSIAWKSLLILWILSGFLTWLIGRDSYHIGSSGLIFGLMFFLFFSGIFRNYIPLIALSLIVAFVYGSSFWSIFPFAQYVDVHLSWEGHLAGAVSGIIVAIVFRNQGPQNPEKIWNDEDNWFDDESESENHADNENLN